MGRNTIIARLASLRKVLEALKNSVILICQIKERKSELSQGKKLIEMSNHL